MASNFTFDPEDRESWSFGKIKREDANLILNAEGDRGVFLVRDSASIIGDLVLCVKEDNKNSHYIINKRIVNGVTRYKIGDQEFPDMPSLLSFYKTHYLDSTSLIRPALRRVIGKFRFLGKDADDLPFEKGDMLAIVRKDEDQWWTARNSRGEEGQIPVPYVEELTIEAKKRIEEELKRKQPTPPNTKPDYNTPNIGGVATQVPRIDTQRKLPALAEVTKARVPNAYDSNMLKLSVGEIVKVIATNKNGEWEGIIGDRQGLFPFTHVKFLDPAEDDNAS